MCATHFRHVKCKTVKRINTIIKKTLPHTRARTSWPRRRRPRNALTDPPRHKQWMGATAHAFCPRALLSRCFCVNAPGHRDNNNDNNIVKTQYPYAFLCFLRTRCPGAVSKYRHVPFLQTARAGKKTDETRTEWHDTNKTGDSRPQSKRKDSRE